MRRDEDRRPWGLIVLLVLAGTAGLVSLPLQVATLKNQNAASRADVVRAQMLTEALADQQAATAADAKAFREDSRRLALAQCDQIEAIARQVGLKIPPCPRVATNPPTKPPTPSGR